MFEANFKYFLILLFLFSACQYTGKEREKNAFLHRGNLAVKEKLFKEAIRYYEEAIRIDTTFALAYFNTGIAYQKLDEPSKAIDAFSRAIDHDSTLLTARFQRAECLIETAKYQPALRDLHACMRANPDSVIFAITAGMAHFYQKAYDSAEFYFQRSIELDDLEADAYVNLGTVYYYQGKFADAQQVLLKAVDLDPEEANAYNVLGLLSIDRGAWDESEKYLSEALRLTPDDPYFLNNYGYLKLQTGALEEAADYIDKSIVLNHENPWAYRNKGIYYLKSGRESDAIRTLEQALEMDATLRHAQYFLGQAYHASGMKKKACTIWHNDTSNWSIEASAKYCD